MKMLEISVIKSFPASCLNRDDMNTPKSMVFGGVERARWSSQSKKYWLRNDELFKTLLGDTSLSIRTRKIHEIVVEKLRERGISEDYFEGVSRILSGFGKNKVSDKDLKNPQGTSQLIVYSDDEINIITDVIEGIINEVEDVNKFNKLTNKNKEVDDFNKKIAEKLGKEDVGISLDIALFGRMTTTKGLTHEDGVMRVAHAFSTHKVALESDFFIAVDDLILDQGDLGAAMMADIEFNSACYYEYANIDIDELIINLGRNDITEKEILGIIPNLVKSFVYVNPGGKQNTFAAHVLPSAILVEIKDRKIQTNYANAFVDPVKYKDGNDILSTSILRLVEEVNRVDRFYGEDIGLNTRFWLDTLGVASPENCVKCNSLSELTEGIKNVLLED